MYLVKSGLCPFRVLEILHEISESFAVMKMGKIRMFPALRPITWNLSTADMKSAVSLESFETEVSKKGRQRVYMQALQSLLR